VRAAAWQAVSDGWVVNSSPSTIFESSITHEANVWKVENADQRVGAAPAQQMHADGESARTTAHRWV
jgi:hypothetical protein